MPGLPIGVEADRGERPPQRLRDQLHGEFGSVGPFGSERFLQSGRRIVFLAKLPGRNDVVASATAKTAETLSLHPRASRISCGSRLMRCLNCWNAERNVVVTVPSSWPAAARYCHPVAVMTTPSTG